MRNPNQIADNPYLGELIAQAQKNNLLASILLLPLKLTPSFPYFTFAGISRDNWHKRRKTGGKRKPYHKKRKYELGRPAANTKVTFFAGGTSYLIRLNNVVAWVMKT